MKGKTIAILGLTGLGVWVASVYNSAKSLSFGLGKIQNLKISNGAISLILNVRATNGNITGVPLTGLNIDNYFGKSIIGKCILTSSVYLSGQSTTDIPIQITIPLTDLLLLVPEIRNVVNTKTVVFSLRGTVSAVGITAPIEQNYVLNLKDLF